MIILLAILLFLLIYTAFKGSKNTIKPPVPPNVPIRKEPDTRGNSQRVPVFRKTWTLQEFHRKFDRVKMSEFPDKYKRKRNFKACIFIKDNDYTFVGFYNIKEPTKEELIQQQKELKVGLKDNGRYYIYKGEMPYEEPVDLGL